MPKEKPNLDIGVLGRVSIIIPSYKQLPYIKACLESIIAYTDYPDYEIIVSDDASGLPKLESYLKDMERQGKIRLFLHNERRLVLNTMKVFPESTGQFICWVNDDVEIPKECGNWLKVLVNALVERRETTASVTPIMYHGEKNKTIYWCGKRIEHREQPFHDFLHEPFGSPRIPKQPVECCYNTGSCQLTWRGLIEALPLGIKAKLYGVDSQWCFMIRTIYGLTHYMIPDTYVYHANIYSLRGPRP